MIAAIFLAIMAWLIRIGFSTGGSVFGAAVPAVPTPAPAVGVEGGGPPPAVRAALGELRARIAAHPKDDVALTQLGDMYLAAGKYASSIPYYRRALRANPGNAAAREGLNQAQAALRGGQ